MTQEEKQLLFKDLCARLPYGVRCQMKDKIQFIGKKSPYYDYILSERHIELFRRHKDFYIKPYLRPMSSMTEEERKEFESLGWRIDEIDGSTPWNHNSYCVFDGVDWLNAHHFDYRNLIERELALEAPVDMYNLNNNI